MTVRIFLLCAMECMCAQTTPQFILSSERVLGEWSQNSCYLQGKNPLYLEKIPLRGGWNPRRCIKHDSQSHTLSKGYSGLFTCHSLCLLLEYSGTRETIPVVCWLLDVPETCECISGTDLRRQFYVLPH